MIAVANASPLISLSSVGALNLLESLFGTIHIPEAVYAEIVVTGAGRAGSAEVAAATWIQRHTIADTNAVSQLITNAKLNAGESETLILVAALKADLVIIDERPARRYALTQGLSIVGTLGVLLLAKSQGFLPEVKPLLNSLSEAQSRAVRRNLTPRRRMTLGTTAVRTLSSVFYCYVMNVICNVITLQIRVALKILAKNFRPQFFF